MIDPVEKQITSPVDNHGLLDDARDVLSPTNQVVEALKDVTFGSVSRTL